MATETASLGLEVNWQKTKVQALGSREDEPTTITVQGQEVVVVEEFVYLGSLIPSTTQSSPDISHCNAITRAAMQNLDSHILKSRIFISTKLKLCNTCILPIFLTVLRAGQLPRGMYTRLMLSINGVCVSCWESNGTTMCGMMMWDGKLSNHTFRLLFKHDDFPCLATLHECQTNQMPSRS